MESAKRIDDLTARVAKLEHLLEDATTLIPGQNAPIRSFHDPSGSDVHDQETQISGLIASDCKVMYPLPSFDEAMILVRDFFDCFNPVFPLFDECSFMCDIAVRYTSHDSDDPAWWAALNVILSLAHQMRAVGHISGGGVTLETGGHLQNALRASSELPLRRPELSTVEAILGTAFSLTTTSN